MSDPDKPTAADRPSARERRPDADAANDPPSPRPDADAPAEQRANDAVNGPPRDPDDARAARDSPRSPDEDALARRLANDAVNGSPRDPDDARAARGSPRSPDEDAPARRLANAATELKPGRRASAADATVPDKPGAVVSERPSRPSSRYVPGEEIARGGMGRVALATDTLLERVVAVKQALTLDPETLRRFARETKITARLEHPSIVPVYDAGTDGDAPYYVMRRVSGRPLAELILASPSLDARLALIPHLLAAAQAVAHAHARGIVHRDIKPANILAGDLGETVVIDWGLAKVVDEPDDDDPHELAAGDSLRTRAGTVFGTPGFMSPEQVRGEPAGYAADVYALGASLYFVLSGKPPHHAATGDAMLVLAAEGPPVPLAKLVPGVSRDLATIVDTALAYGEKRYRDASAFAEDLRRFSTGQFVASHRYSSRERLWKFVRRNRAAVAIAFVATVVIAMLATISIRRVIEERDRADAEARDAALAQNNERERADQLLLLRARTLVETNPTEALALLKELAPTSPRLAEAHGIANAAIMRGVPWAIHGNDSHVAQVELDSTGTFLLQVTMNGEVRVWDLVRRVEVVTKKFRYGVRGIWIGPRILVYGSEPAAFLEPATGALTPTALPKLETVYASDDQNVLFGRLDGTREVIRFERDGSKPTPIWPGHRATWMDVAGNGAWLALTDGTELLVMRPDGTVIARRTGKLSVVSASRKHHMAVLDDLQLLELDLRTLTWRTIDTTKYHRLVISFSYRGEEMILAMGSGHLLAMRDDRLVELVRPEGGFAFNLEVGHDEYLFLSGSSAAYYFHPYGHRILHFPQVLAQARIAGRRGVSRVAIVSPEVILVYDLATLSPRKLPAPPGTKAEFFDENTLLMSNFDPSRLWWHDIETGKETVVDKPMFAIHRSTAFDRESDDVIANLFFGETAQLYRFHKHSTQARLLYDGPPLSHVQALSGDGVFYASGPHVSTQVGKTTRELVTFEQAVAMITKLPGGRFVAMSIGGELARGNLDGGPLERAQVEAPPRGTAVAPTGRTVPPAMDVLTDGVVLVTWGRKVWRWTAQLEPFATLDTNVIDVMPVGTEILVMLANGRTALIEPATGVVHRVPAHGAMIVPPTRRNAFAVEISDVFHFVELSSRTTWPTSIPKLGEPALSDNGHRLLLQTTKGLLLWDIPHGSGPMRVRLDQFTNATVTPAGTLTWPWAR